METDFSTFLADSRLTVDHCLEIMARKNHDYSSTQDPFINFKTAAEAAGITPAQAILTLIGMKIARLSQLVGTEKRPLNESVEDSVMDLINYALLLRGVLKENSA